MDGRGLKIQIGGHTDSDGTHANNLKLSKERAQTVQQYLLERGVSRYQIKFKGHGETKPITSNATDYGKQQNCRVDF